MVAGGNSPIVQTPDPLDRNSGYDCHAVTTPPSEAAEERALARAADAPKGPVERTRVRAADAPKGAVERTRVWAADAPKGTVARTRLAAADAPERSVEQALLRVADAPERSVERALVQAAHAAGGVARKLLTPGVRGAPDRLVLLPGGVVRFVECKGRGGRLSASQCREHARLRALGCEVWVVWTVEEARAACRVG